MYYCRTAHYYIFLDLHRDRYFALEAEKIEAAGGLTAHSHLAHAVGPPVMSRPAGNLVRTGAARRRRIRFPTTCTFLTSALRAGWWLRVGALERTVASVDRRKREQSSARLPFDFDRARTLLAAFETLRPWIPANYRCLFDSLALLDFLAAHALFPTWVFGVEEEPFEAHCWVQAEGVVLNDTLECVSGFTPIMAV